MAVDTYLNKSVSNYLKYVKCEKGNFYINNFPVNLNSDFDFSKIVHSLNTLSLIIETLPNHNTIQIYSLQNTEDNYSARIYWSNELWNLIGKKESKTIYIFLLDSGSDSLEKSYKKYNNWNSTDTDFCHSMMMRDIIYKNRKGFDFDLSLAEVKQEDLFVFWKELNRKTSKLNIDGKIYFNKTFIEKIVKLFNDYFPKAKLDQNVYHECITDFYSYGLNNQSFANLKDDNPIVDEIRISDISTGHELYGSVIKEMKESPSIKDISKLSKWLIYLNLLSDLTKLFIHYCELEKEIKILLIDDKPENIDKEIKFIKEISDQKIVIENEKGKPILKFEKYDELFDSLETGGKNIPDDIKDIYNNIINGGYDFLIIDLDYYGELKGFEYLRKLRKAKTIYSKPFVIVFTRNEDPKSVQKALNMGALFVASKQNVAHLIFELYKVLPLVCESQDRKTDYPLGHNWSLLYQLPLNKILSLKSESEKICGKSYKSYQLDSEDYGFNNEKLKTDKEYRWINKLPKAELHCHIGSVLGPDLIPKTSLLVLAQKYKNKIDNIRPIIKFILPIVTDPFLFEEIDDILEEKVEIFNDFGDYANSEWYKLKNSLIIDASNQFKHQSVFTIISDSLNLKAFKNKTPEEVILSPEDETLEKQFIPFSRLKTSDYFNNKLKLRELGVKYDEVILFFILILNLRENENKAINKKSFEESLEDNIKEIAKVFNKFGNENFHFPHDEVESFKDTLLKEFEQLSNILSIPFYKPSIESKSILEFLVSAHSNRRCLDFHNRGLFYYLRGCEYGGAPHLQSKESIFLVAHHIIYNYAIPDNIRYLDLRCAIDGYNKFKLFKQTEDDKQLSISKIIVDTLKESFTFWQRKAFEETNKKTHVNLIITAKRHKSIKEFEENILITVENYNHPKEDKINKIKSYFDTETEIISFDLAGLEKGNRVSRFKEKLDPLLEKCIPITMHAGEEDSHEAIWEAYYLAHAQRIGHALTLKDNEKLMNSVREAFVNIELCPISNYLTNKNYSFNSASSKDKYPLKDYLTKRISVSINTDNPFVSNSNLTKEFLFAAKISGGLTRWEILKIILYSFKSITIHKSLKTKLLKEINEEIYELLLNEGE